jgi:hypothetical protein
MRDQTPEAARGKSVLSYSEGAARSQRLAGRLGRVKNLP